MSYSNVYAQALNVDLNAMSQAPSIMPTRYVVAPVDSHIPLFLVKKS
jgi:hypothetical protein